MTETWRAVGISPPCGHRKILALRHGGLTPTARLRSQHLRLHTHQEADHKAQHDALDRREGNVGYEDREWHEPGR